MGGAGFLVFRAFAFFVGGVVALGLREGLGLVGEDSGCGERLAEVVGGADADDVDAAGPWAGEGGFPDVGAQGARADPGLGGVVGAAVDGHGEGVALGRIGHRGPLAAVEAVLDGGGFLAAVEEVDDEAR